MSDVKSEGGLERPRCFRHTYAEVRWEIVGKLNEIATPYFQAAVTLSNLTTVIYACQRTYDTIVTIRKDLNRARSNPTSVKDTLEGQIKSLSSQLDTARKAASSLNHPDSVKKLLRKLFGQFNDGKWKENLGINDIKFVVDRLESLLSERKRRLLTWAIKRRSGRKIASSSYHEHHFIARPL